MSYPICQHRGGRRPRRPAVLSFLYMILYIDVHHACSFFVRPKKERKKCFKGLPPLNIPAILIAPSAHECAAAEGEYMLLRCADRWRLRLIPRRDAVLGVPFRSSHGNRYIHVLSISPAFQQRNLFSMPLKLVRCFEVKRFIAQQRMVYNTAHKILTETAAA